MILLRKKYWLTSLLNVGFLSITLWIADFILSLISNYSIGTVDYLLAETNPILHTLAYQHLFIYPIAVFSLYLIGGAQKNAWKGSLVYIAILLVISLQAGLVQNVNCVYSMCISLFPNTTMFIFIQHIVLLLSIIPANYLLVKITKH